MTRDARMTAKLCWLLIVLLPVLALLIWLLASGEAASAAEPRRASGPAIVVDGDTLEVGGVRWRLAGIQAPELHERGGLAAERALRRLVVGREVVCVQRGSEVSWERLVGFCSIVGPRGPHDPAGHGRDLGAALLELGRACRWVKYDPQERYAWAPCEVRP